MKMTKIVMVLITLALAACSSKPVEDQKVVALGTTSGTRPFWTYDGDVDRKKLRELFGDDGSEPKNMYVISRAKVANEDMVPNCYQIASTRTSSDIAKSVSETVKSANALSSSADVNEFEGLITTQTQQMIVGATVVEKTWAKLQEGNDVKVYCWVVMSMPRTNLTKLQDIVTRQLELASSGDPALKQRVKTAVDKISAEF